MLRTHLECRRTAHSTMGQPDNPSLFADAALDLTHSKTELILENAFLPQQLIVLNRQVKRPAGEADQQAAVLETGSGHRAT